MRLLLSLSIWLLTFIQTLSAIDFEKVYFDSIIIEKTTLAEAVSQINLIHKNQSAGGQEFIILLEEPTNMVDETSINLDDANLGLLMDFLLLGTKYEYAVLENYLIIKQSNQVTYLGDQNSEKNASNTCIIDVIPSFSDGSDYKSIASTGSGFLCKLNGIPFLITNIHVIENANRKSDIKVRTTNNIPISLGDFYVANDRDICIIRVGKEHTEYCLEKMKVFPSLAKREQVYILGNPLGGGVIRKASGRLLGIGEKFLEIDVSAFKGNSGGPIIDTKSNKVMGVLTKAEIVADDSFTAMSRLKFNNIIEDDIRIYGTRFDNISSSKWEKIIWKSWRQSRDEIDRHKELVKAFSILVAANMETGVLTTDEISLSKCPEIWRIYSSFYDKYNRHVNSGNRTSRVDCLMEFIKAIEVMLRPIEGVLYNDLAENISYSWFEGTDSGNIDYGTARNLRKWYSFLHEEWKETTLRWGNRF